jgi:hypothetical protein
VLAWEDAERSLAPNRVYSDQGDNPVLSDTPPEDSLPDTTRESAVSEYDGKEELESKSPRRAFEQGRDWYDNLQDDQKELAGLEGSSQSSQEEEKPPSRRHRGFIRKVWRSRPEQGKKRLLSIFS